MELERFNTVFFAILSKITLFLYGIGAILKVLFSHFLLGLHYSYMELELINVFCSLIVLSANYIIPIWNWSEKELVTLELILTQITLFLYGIGAILC